MKPELKIPESTAILTYLGTMVSVYLKSDLIDEVRVPTAVMRTAHVFVFIGKWPTFGFYSPSAVEVSAKPQKREVL